MKLTLTLPELPFDKNALNPIITEETFDYHYGKHHAAYVNNLTSLVKDTALENASIEDIIQKSFTENNAPLFNNAAQHWNHRFLWNCLSPNGGKTHMAKLNH